jgi:hypothetical protein
MPPRNAPKIVTAPALQSAGFVARVIQDPKHPPSVALLAGFPGAAAQPGHTRLYLDLELRSYLDLPDESILHHEGIPGPAAALGATFVWIARGDRARQAQAGFLRGSLAPHQA